MNIEDFIKKYTEDKEFAAEFKPYTNFEELLNAVNEKGYSITKEDVLTFLGKEKNGQISEADLAKLVGNPDDPVGFSTACSDACSASCSTKC